MGTTADKLNKLVENKNAIKGALEEVGMFPSDKMSEYPQMIVGLGNSYKDYIKTVEGNWGAEINIPSGITKIGNSIYESATLVNNNMIVIPEGVTKIGKNTFYNRKIIELYLPKTLTEINEKAFASANMTNHNKVFYNGTVNEYINNMYCTSDWACPMGYFFTSAETLFYCFNEENQKYEQVQEIDIDKNIKINQFCFSTGTNIPVIKIRESANITELKYGQLINGKFLKELYLPKTLTTFTLSLQNATNLEKIEYNGSFSDIFTKITKGNKSSIIRVNFGTKLYCNGELIDLSNGVAIPEDVNEIKGYSIYGKDCTVVLHENINTLYDYAFTDLTNAILIFNSSTPPVFKSSSWAWASSIKAIYVPSGTSNTYKSTTNLTTFASKIFEKNSISLFPSNSILNNENIVFSINGEAKQQFQGSQKLLNVAVITIYNNSGSKLNIGTTEGGSDIASIASGSIYTYNLSGDVSIFLTLQ